MVAMSYAEVMDRVAAAAVRAGREPASVKVVAVSKDRTPDEVLAVYQAGHRDFGENRAQELVGKAAVLPDDIRWHFIGSLQTNKARLVRPAVVLLHSLDRRELGLAWLKGAGPPPPVLVQVNVGEEEQKGGVDPSRLMESVEMASEMGLEVKGLMAIPPVPNIPESSRPYFRRMAELGARVRDKFPSAVELSMGMTDDFEVAIEEGGTIIRVGRAIFHGDRATGV
jgi:PLP dependent protein